MRAIQCQVATEPRRRQGGETGRVAASSDEGAELQRLVAMKGIVAESGGDEADVSTCTSVGSLATQEKKLKARAQARASGLVMSEARPKPS